jgi:hypothetical protein
MFAVGAVLVSFAGACTAAGSTPSAPPSTSSPASQSAAPVLSPPATVELITPLPTPVVTPLPSLPEPGANWIGLGWSDPIAVNLPWRYPPQVLVEWQGWFIGIGDPGLDSPGPLVASSTDLVKWTPLASGASAPSVGSLDLQVAAGPSQIVIFAMAPGPMLCGGCVCTNGPSGVVDEIWTSPDGVSWDRSASTAVFDGGNVWSVAGGPSGMVAVGDRGFHRPAIWFSTTGSTWRELKVPSALFESAGLHEVAAVPRGFVAGGSVGGSSYLEQPGYSGDAGGDAAAWWSPDGLSWSKASVESPPLEKLHFGHVYVAPSGLVATGWADDSQGFSAWTSPDGRSWDYLDSWQSIEPGGPWRDILVDGGRLLGLVHGPDTDTNHLWESLDGKSWHELTLTGNAQAIEMLGWSARRFLTPDGMLQQPWDSIDGRFVMYRGTALTDGNQARIAGANVVAHHARPGGAAITGVRTWPIFGGGGTQWRVWSEPGSNAPC